MVPRRDQSRARPRVSGRNARSWRVNGTTKRSKPGLPAGIWAKRTQLACEWYHEEKKAMLAPGHLGETHIRRVNGVTTRISQNPVKTKKRRRTEVAASVRLRGGLGTYTTANAAPQFEYTIKLLCFQENGMTNLRRVGCKSVKA